MHFPHLAESWQVDDVTYLVRSHQGRSDRTLIRAYGALEVVPKPQNRIDFVVREAHIDILSLGILTQSFTTLA